MSAAARQSERRIGERRRERRPTGTDESWFGAFAPMDDIADPTEPQSRFDKGLQRAEGAEPDPGFLSRQAARVVESGHSAFGRIYRTFIGARAALGIALVLVLGVAGLFGLRPSYPLALVTLTYAGLAMATWLLPRFRRVDASRVMSRLRSPQWLATIGADLVCFSVLHLLAPGSSLNYVALLVLPVLMAGVLTPRMLALATAAAATLVLLVSAWLSGSAGADGTLQITQAGLAGVGFFVITVLAGELAGRLAREELTARGSLEMARQQAQLNRLVIEEMQDGVLVVDRRGRVRAANPAARRLLAPTDMSRPAPFQLRGVEAWSLLVKAVEQAFVEGAWPEAGRDVALQFETAARGATRTVQSQRTLRLRVRFTRRREADASEEFCVLFLEDVRNMQARTRQEKLAAMGRVSVGIAHEIRNPLAAISQANALLSEDATEPAQRRLMQMVADNVERLKRIVDDVMEVAPGGVAQEAGVIDAGALVAQVCADWVRGVTSPAGEPGLLQIELPDEPIGVVFDAEHLRRVLVNLLDNALRHGSGHVGAIQLRLDSRHEGQAFLSLASDGEPIAADVEPYLFEPFFSTRSRGSGLGLYICRELCERYGATIDYRLRTVGEGQRNEFFVNLRRRSLNAAQTLTS